MPDPRMPQHRFGIPHYGSVTRSSFARNAWRVRYVALAGLLALSLLAMTARAVMTYHSDDNHFAMGAQLVADGYKPYADFPYFQMPYASYIFGAVLKAQLSPYKYLTLRLANLAFCIGSIALLYLVCSRVAGSRRVALAGALLFSSSQFLNFAAEQLNSYAIANFFALVSFATLTVVDQPPTRRAFLSGFFLGAAIASKLYYLLLAVPMLVYAITLIQPATRRSAVRTGLSWSTGFALVLLPVAALAAIDPAVFWFDNFGYHVLNSTYREVAQSGDGMTAATKLRFLVRMLATPAYLSVLILGLVLFARTNGHLRMQYASASGSGNRTVFLAAASVAVMFVAAVTPRPLWSSYFLAPLPFAIIALACLYRTANEVEKATDQPWDRSVMNVAILVAALSVPSDLYRLKRASNVDAWATVTVHRDGQRIRDLVTGRGRDAPLLAFEGLYAMEAGMPFYRQMAGATFAYRVGDLMDGSLRVRSSITSKGNIAALLDADPPSGILVSARFDEFNGEMLNYAATNHYREIDAKMPRHRLLVRAGEKN